jgi:5-methyltetrahydropteroyltriglutamate--homocysteine methyltransferase
VRPGAIAVLGLITTKSGELEDRDDLLRRIEEASRFLPVEQLAISPQCGFASGVEGNDLTPDEQWAKLDLMLEVAQQVWN